MPDRPAPTLAGMLTLLSSFNKYHMLNLRRGVALLPPCRHLRRAHLKAILAAVRIYTKTGDDGTTGLLFGSRISKAHPAAEAYGTVDETVAVLGLARAITKDQALGELLLEHPA